MEVEEIKTSNQLSKEDVNTYARQKLKAYTAKKLLQFEKRIKERFTQSGRKVPPTIVEGTLKVFHEFDRVCDRYISMFELYCERNVLVQNYPDIHVTQECDFCDQEKELDRKLEKRKYELLECYRKRNILKIQRKLIESDFGKALCRLGALADSCPLHQLQEDIKALQNSDKVCNEARELTASLQELIGEAEQEDDMEWIENDPNNMNIEMMQGLMKCFDVAGLSYICLFNKYY